MPRLVGSSLIAGLALGLFSAMGDRLPPDTVLHVVVAMANAAGPWLITAFGVGALQPSPPRGAAAATLALAVAVAAYYAGIYAAGNEVADVMRVAGAWLVVAVVVGPILGAAAGTWSGRTRHRIMGVSLLAGSLLAEAVFRLVQVEVWTGIDVARTDIQVGMVDAAAGLLAPILLLGPDERMRGFAISLLVGAVGTGIVAGATLALRWAIVG
jgi:hypothetical protein